MLFAAMFPGSLKTTFEVNRFTSSNVDEDGALRVLLHVLAPDLRCLPWELAYDGSRREWLSSGRATPLSRYVDVAAPPAREISLPIRILICMPNQTICL